MPQFDTNWFLGEAFWMLLCFGVFYVLTAYILMPLYQDVFAEREHKIKNDLSVAEAVNNQAAQLIQDYNGRIYSARQTKAEILNETYQDIQKYAAHIDSEHEHTFRQQIEDAEQKMRYVKESVLQESDQVATVLAHELTQKLVGKERKNQKDKK